MPASIESVECIDPVDESLAKEGSGVLVGPPPAENPSENAVNDALPLLVWRWAKAMKARFAGDPRALEVLEVAFDEAKLLVSRATGDPWFELDALIIHARERPGHL